MDIAGPKGACFYCLPISGTPYNPLSPQVMIAELRAPLGVIQPPRFCKDTIERREKQEIEPNI